MQESFMAVAQLLNQYRSSHQIPGMAVGMIVDGEMVYSQGFGTADVNSPYHLVRPDTVFSIQGITESFTATALVHLEEHSSFKLDRPVGEYLPSFESEQGGLSFTTADLLAHAAGFSEQYSMIPLLDHRFYQFVKNMPEYQYMLDSVPKTFKSERITRAEVMNYLASLNLKTKPGEMFHYFSAGYLIAADVLEKVSGMSWEKYMLTHIFQPLGLKNTTIHAPTNLDEKKVATYYMKGIGDPIQTPTPKNRLGAPVGSVFSTAEDLAIYLKAQMTPGRLLSSTSMTKMQSSYVSVDQEEGYGLGWKLRDFQGMNVVEQTGSYPGLSSSVSFIPEKQFGLVLLCNMDMIPLSKLALRIMRRWFF